MSARDRLLEAIEQVESGGRRDAVSPKGARGRMQVMPATARQPGYKVRPARNESEEEYTRVGRDYALALLDYYGGDLEATLVAYNYGPGNANKWIASGRNKSDLPKETRNYITRVGKQLGGDKMARRPLEFVKQDKLSELTKKAVKNPDSADARKVVRELIARGLPVPKKLQASIGKARARAGVGSPPRKVPRPKRKPAAPKQPTQEEFMRGQARAFNAPRGDTVRPPVSREEFMRGQARAFNAPRGDSFTPPPQVPFYGDEPGAPYRGSGRGIAGPPVPERQLRRGVSRVPRGDFGVGSGLTDRAKDIRITPADFGMGYDPNLDPSTGIGIDDDVRQDMRDTPRGTVSSGGRSKGRGGIDAGLLEFIQFAGGRDAFKPDAIDRGLAYLGGGEVSDPMVKAEATYLNSLYDKQDLGLDLTEQEQSFMDNFGKKKGGRLKKKKRVVRKKKAAPKKKKPVVRKKAVAKKAPVRKKAVAKKPAARKRAAKRGFGAELRGN